MILHALMNLGFAGGTASTTPAVFGDLTTLFANYTQNTLRDAQPTKTDTTTLVEKDRPTVVAGTASKDDLNTAYAEYLS